MREIDSGGRNSLLELTDWTVTQPKVQLLRWYNKQDTGTLQGLGDRKGLRPVQHYTETIQKCPRFHSPLHIPPVWQWATHGPSDRPVDKAIMKSTSESSCTAIVTGIHLLLRHSNIPWFTSPTAWIQYWWTDSNTRAQLYPHKMPQQGQIQERATGSFSPSSPPSSSLDMCHVGSQ